MDAFTLRFQTYTVDAYDEGTELTDYTGFSVVSDKPISVSAGHGNVMVSASVCYGNVSMLVELRSSWQYHG